jgi:signal transduction histidine kinase
LAELQASHLQLKETQLRLIEAAKMESIGRMAANVAHEVKNPLQTILMGLTYISNNLPSRDEDMVLAIACMRDAVRRADAIVRDLLYLSSAQKLELNAEDLNEIIASSLCMVNLELSQSRLDVVRDLADALPSVMVDRARIEQVFINLLLNAAQAMTTGGTLTVRTFTRIVECGQECRERRRAPFQPGDVVVVAEIEDTGVGIAPDKLRRIFEPFFTTKPSGVGTGLGLPVSKQIVELHGGAITLQPAARQGVRVSVMLKAKREGSLCVES